MSFWSPMNWPSFHLLIDALQPHAATVEQALLAEMQAAMPEQFDKINKRLSAANHQQLRDARWKRQSMAAVVLVQLGFGDRVWSLLEFSANPSLRSFVMSIIWANSGPTTTRSLAACRSRTEVTVRRALIQSLGKLDPALIAPADRDRITQQLQMLYVD